MTTKTKKMSALGGVCLTPQVYQVCSAILLLRLHVCRSSRVSDCRTCLGYRGSVQGVAAPDAYRPRYGERACCDNSQAAISRIDTDSQNQHPLCAKPLPPHRLTREQRQLIARRPRAHHTGGLSPVPALYIPSAVAGVSELSAYSLAVPVLVVHLQQTLNGSQALC